ncbi:MAG: DUF6504 family protein [bacterium]|nr:DUF6504 family protein [bacterium]
MRKKKKVAKSLKTYLKQGDELYAVNEPICVDTYCGYRDNEHPRSFLWRGKQYEVLRAIASWRVEQNEPPRFRAEYYRLETVDGIIFDCKYEATAERWVLVGTELDQESWPKIN